MAIYLTGDTHGHIDIAKLNIKNFPEQKKLTRKDYVIVLGDFGLVWDKSRRQEFMLEELNKRSWTTLWIDGNHENFELLKEFPVEEWNGGKVHKIKENIIHLMRGQIFNIDGKSFFTMGGASSIDITERMPYISWWPEEECTSSEVEEAIINLQKHNYKVDFILTHTCSSSSLDKIAAMERFFIDKYDANNRFLQHIKENVEYRHWYYGHFHIDKEIYDNETAVYKKIIKL